jgi:solute carrier family 25 protein 38
MTTGGATTNVKSKKDFLAGSLSGLICGTIFQPLEVIKINMIILPNGYNFNSRNSFQNFSDICKIIYQSEGLRGFWLGTTPSVLRASLSSGVYFALLRMFDKISEHRYHVNKKASDFIDSGVARTITGLLTNPLCVMRTRWEIIGNHENKNFLRSFAHLLKTERSNLFFKGGLSIAYEEFLFGGIFNLTYEYLNRRVHVENKQSKIWFFCNGLIAGVMGTIITHPFEISRTKIQSNKAEWGSRMKSSVIISIFLDIFYKHGLKGFSKGLYPRLIKKTVVTASSFYLYEVFRQRKLK